MIAQKSRVPRIGGRNRNESGRIRILHQGTQTTLRDQRKAAQSHRLESDRQGRSRLRSEPKSLRDLRGGGDWGGGDGKDGRRKNPRKHGPIESKARGRQMDTKRHPREKPKKAEMNKGRRALCKARTDGPQGPPREGARLPGLPGIRCR